MFQSAPLTEARGDASSSASTHIGNLFQSAPLTEARGDLPVEPSPAYRPGFNPLPSPKQGETEHRVVMSQQLGRFNPLPSPKQGETSLAQRYRSS